MSEATTHVCDGRRDPRIRCQDRDEREERRRRVWLALEAGPATATTRRCGAKKAAFL